MKGKKNVSKQKLVKKKPVVKKSKVVKKVVAKKAPLKKAVKKPTPKKVIQKAKVVKPAPKKVIKKVKKVPGEYSNKHLVKALKLLGYKAADLARRLEVPSASMSLWLNDKKVMPLEHALNIEVMTAGKVKAKALNPEAYAVRAKALRREAKAHQQTVLERLRNETSGEEASEAHSDDEVTATYVMLPEESSEDVDNADHALHEAEACLEEVADNILAEKEAQRLEANG